MIDGEENMNEMASDGNVRRESLWEREPFNSEKVYKACVRSGATAAIAKSVTEQIEGILYDGISTREIYHEVRRLLEASRVEVAARYSLKEALMHLGPAGFPFETYLGELLEEYGYETRLKCSVEENLYLDREEILCLIEG